MATILISFANGRFFESQKKLNTSAKRYKIEKIIKFNIIWLFIFHFNFIIKNRKHFRHKKGAGYWVWKPLIILKVLEKMGQDDYLIYLDSGIEIIKPINVLLGLCDKHKGILLFSTHYFKNKEYTKRDAFVKLQCDSQSCHNSYQLEAGMMVLKKNENSVRFITQWLSICEDYSLVSDHPNILGKPDLHEFIAHRHDQSLLSLLAWIQKIEPLRSPHQFTNNLKKGEFRIPNEFLDNNPRLSAEVRGKYANVNQVLKNSPYGTLFNHHRKRESLKTFKLIYIILAFFCDAILTQKWLTTP